MIAHSLLVKGTRSRCRQAEERSLDQIVFNKVPRNAYIRAAEFILHDAADVCRKAHGEIIQFVSRDDAKQLHVALHNTCPTSVPKMARPKNESARQYQRDGRDGACRHRCARNRWLIIGHVLKQLRRCQARHQNVESAATRNIYFRANKLPPHATNFPTLPTSRLVRRCDFYIPQ